MVDGSDTKGTQDEASVTPLPLDQMVCALFIQLCEALNVNVLFPFMAFMVEDFGYTGERLGYYVGCLAAAFCTAQFFSSVLWGKISDVYGRKSSIIIGTAGTVLGMLIFGLATTYTQAILGRFIAGLLSGNIGVLKTYTTEFTDDSNRATAFSYLSAAWAGGCIVAPLFGGLLCNPADKYPAYFDADGIFGRFPYLLPIVLCVLLLIVSIIVCLVYMAETNAKILLLRQGQEEGQGRNHMHKEIEMTKALQKATQNNGNSNGKNSSNNPLHSDADADANGSAIEFNTDADKTDNEDNVGTNRNNDARDDVESNVEDIEMISSSSNGADNDSDGDSDDEDCFLCASQSNSNRRRSKYQRTQATDDGIDRSNHALIHDVTVDGDQVAGMKTSSNKSVAEVTNSSTTGADSNKSNPLTKRVVVLACCNYMMLCMAFILFDETLPLYLKLSVDQGGFAFTSLNIGALLSSAGGFLMIFASFILPRIGRHSKKSVFCYSISIVTCHVLLWPLCGAFNRLLLRTYSAATAEFITYPLLLVLLSLKVATASTAFMASTIQVNHSVRSEHLGLVNGFAQALGAMARGIGPALGGVLWSTSTAMGFVYLNFIAVALLWALNLFVNSLLPQSLDRKKGSSSSNNNINGKGSKSSNDKAHDEEDKVALEF